MRILVTDSAMYVNHRLPCLTEYDNSSICVVKLNPDTDDINQKYRVADVSSYKTYTDSSLEGYNSWQYKCIMSNAKEIEGLFMSSFKDKVWYHGAVILGDLNNDVLYVLDVLQKSKYSEDIHLILPLPFEMTVKGTIQHEILSNLDKVKSLAVYDPYKLAKEKYGDTAQDSIRKVIVERTKYLLGKFAEMSYKMKYQSQNSKYFFEAEKDSYIDTDSLYVLSDYEITHTLGIMANPYSLYKGKEENQYIIEQFKTPVPRPDGKNICEQLRSIRKEFARLNGIDYKFGKCSYNGPCAGTCEVCDNEAKELYETAKKLDDVKYPELDLEELL